MGNSVTVWQLAAISMHVLMTTGSQCGRNAKAAAWRQAVLHPCHMEHMDDYHKCMLSRGMASHTPRSPKSRNNRHLHPLPQKTPAMNIK